MFFPAGGQLFAGLHKIEKRVPALSVSSHKLECRPGGPNLFSQIPKGTRRPPLPRFRIPVRVASAVKPGARGTEQKFSAATLSLRVSRPGARSSRRKFPKRGPLFWKEGTGPRALLRRTGPFPFSFPLVVHAVIPSMALSGSARNETN
jgi:hypothetical protein